MMRYGVLSVAVLSLVWTGCPAKSGGPTGPGRARTANGSPKRRTARPRPTGIAAIYVQGTKALARRPAPDYQAALAAFEKVLKKRPRHVPTLRNLAYCQLHLALLPQAEASYRQAQKIVPQHRDVLLGLSDVLQRRGRAAEALPLLLAQLKRTPKDLTTLGHAAASIRFSVLEEAEFGPAGFHLLAAFLVTVAVVLFR